MRKRVIEKLEYRAIPGPKSAQYLQVSQSYEPACAVDQSPIVWDHGEGVWVWDVDGNRYIDFTSGVLVTNLGHNHPKLVKAIQEQAPRLMNTYSHPTQERVTASMRMVQTLPPNLNKVFMLSTGAEATEAALRIARRYTSKQEVLAFYGGFHGRTYGAIGVSGNLNTRRQFGVPVPGGVMAPYGDCYHCVYDKKFPVCDYYCIKILDTIIESSSSGDMGAVIAEPYQGAAGFIFPPDGWLKKLEEWCKARDLLLIIDEVQSSFGRTGKMYAIEWEGLRPNMLCLGKGMGCGIPASAVAAEEQIFEAMKPGELSSTWGGNPLASAAVLAVLDTMQEENLPENSRRIGAHMLPRLLDMKTRYPFLGDVRGRGLVMGLECVDPRSGKPSGEIAEEIVMECAKQGLLLGKVGRHANVIRIAPPLIISEEEADLALDIFEAVFGNLLNE